MNSVPICDDNDNAPITAETTPREQVQVPPPATAGLNSEGPPSEFSFFWARETLLEPARRRAGWPGHPLLECAAFRPLLGESPCPRVLLVPPSPRCSSPSRAVAENRNRPLRSPPSARTRPTRRSARSADLLKQGDIAGLMQNALPPADFAEIKADWGKDRQREAHHRRGPPEIPGHDGQADRAGCREDDLRRDRAAAQAVRRAVSAADADVCRDGQRLAAGHGPAEQGSVRGRQAAGGRGDQRARGLGAEDAVHRCRVGQEGARDRDHARRAI